MEKLKFVEFSFLTIVFLLVVFLFFEVRSSGFAIQSNEEVLSCGNVLNENNILVYSDKIVIKIQNASIQNYADTKSMLPLINNNTQGIIIFPKSEDEINLGDVISFKKDGKEYVHRVIEKNRDDSGVYFITKGDNSEFVDDKIRFSDISGLIVGVIY